ncbi:uncharacterized protein BYT42DRAFT_604134 [Radiomyces spectabilis]|uniref:uncharacterized protein n=1 Tax=Radiomyces spectabilis TaxID=64574 RepID=UPI00221F30DC|nr:uncharacterized protein BYT42DRAFT_591035 [Radiomyces spectabilis]XP_051424384.1 uncharacterized protein BYT42DRAFT_604134 [Radiomyces spectabilis]KAI8364130.1 hypothetical protein BYT42DRAFT_591035 [Radiomyces spectabilis]KAI8381101.1 hypothetical protein BYT42DRAFT_604134 [Radiomyces spectabilis]
MTPPIVHLKWGKHRFDVDLSEYNYDIQQVTVKELKEKCSRLTGVAPEHMKLLAYGAVMKNDALTLSNYGVRARSKIMMLSSPRPEKPAHARPAASQEQAMGAEEKALLAKLEKIKSDMADITKDINRYEDRVKSFQKTSEEDAKEHKKLKDYAVYLGEQLMKTLFELDGLLCGNLETARMERKEGVKKSQALLDRVDRIKASL